jgi:hypothetical protein
MQQYQAITLCIDIIFVNKIPIFLSISRSIRFITAAVLEKRKEASIVKSLEDIYGLYRKRGFRITNILGDSEFECTRGAVATDMKSKLNICGEEEHVPDIERCIRTVKERTRSTYNVTPFDHFSPRMVIEMVFLQVFWLNALPRRLGVSQTLSPRTVVTGFGVDYKKHCRIEYGQYVQTHEKQDNTMTTRTIGALALRPTGNQQGGYYFCSLMSGQRLHRTHWTELPMPAEVRDRVHALPRRANAKVGLKFTDSDGNDLNALYPDDDDPEQDDNSSASSESESSNSDSDDDSDSDLPETELAGVNEPAETPGVTANDDDNIESDDSDDESDAEHNNEPVATTGVGDEPTGMRADETPGVDDHPQISRNTLTNSRQSSTLR